MAIATIYEGGGAAVPMSGVEGVGRLHKHERQQLDIKRQEQPVKSRSMSHTHFYLHISENAENRAFYEHFLGVYVYAFLCVRFFKVEETRLPGETKREQTN